MRNPKSFDCVELKNAIQAKLHEQYASLEPEQVRKKRQEKLDTADNIVARKWRRLKQPRELARG